MNVDIKVSEESSQSALTFMQRILGPVAEAADFLSDKVRFMRWKSAQKTLENAYNIAKARNLKVNEVPVKFLVPFLEKCSLEEESSNLIDKWAELLVSASQNYDIRLNRYVDILSQLGPEEVNILESMWIKTDPALMSKIPNFSLVYGNSSANDELTQNELFNAKIDQKTNVDEYGRLNFTTISVVQGHSILNYSTVSYLTESSVFVLENLGLTKVIARLSQSDTKGDRFTLKFQLTPLGYSFVKACIGGQT